MMSPPEIGIVVDADQAFIDENGVGEVIRKADPPGPRRQLGRAAQDLAALGEFDFGMARQRQLDLGELRQREHLVRDIGRHQVEDLGADIERLALGTIGGDDLGAPWLGAVRNSRIGEQHEAVLGALEHEIGLRRIPHRAVGLVIDRERRLPDEHRLETRHRPPPRVHLRHQHVDGVRRILDCRHPRRSPLVIALARRCLGISEAELEGAVELAADQDPRTDQLEPAKIDPAGQQRRAVDTDRRPRRRRDHVPVFVPELDVAQADPRLA